MRPSIKAKTEEKLEIEKAIIAFKENGGKIKKIKKIIPNREDFFAKKIGNCGKVKREEREESAK